MQQKLKFSQRKLYTVSITENQLDVFSETTRIVIHGRVGVSEGL